MVSPGRWEMLQPAALLEHQPPSGRDSPSPQDGEPGALGTATPHRPSLSTDRRLGTTPRPLRMGKPGLWELLSPQALCEHRPPPGQDSPSPLNGESGPLGTATPRRPSLSTDHCLVRHPRPLRLVRPGRWELLSPAGPPRAPTAALAGLPVPPSWRTRAVGSCYPPQALLAPTTA